MLALAIYMILAVLFYMIAGQQLRVRADSTDSVSPFRLGGGDLVGYAAGAAVYGAKRPLYQLFGSVRYLWPPKQRHAASELYEQAGPDEKTLIEAFFSRPVRLAG